MWETRMREHRIAWRRLVVAGFGGALLLVIGVAPGVRAAPVDHFSITDRSVTEGNAGTVNANFTIRYTGTLNDLTVDWATADNTAVAGADYVAASGTATFSAGGSRSQTITVQVMGDLLDEANETFFVNLSNAQPAATADITDGQGIGRINDDDPLPSITIDDPSVAEGDGGTTTLTYTISLSTPSGRTVSVRAATANGTATQPEDYVPSARDLVFTPGQTSISFQVTVNGDTLDEADADTALVNLSSATNAALADGRGVGSIVDDDPLPSLSIADATRTEGNSGTANLTFTVTLAPVSGRTVTVAWAAADGSALAPADYTASPGTVTFAAGQTSRTFTARIVGDRLDEYDETFGVELSSPTNATIADGQALGTIVDNDAPPSLSVNDASVTEGDAGSTTASFTIALSGSTEKPVAVDFTTVDGTAVAPTDLDAASGTRSFAPGDLSTTVDVTVRSDLIDEYDETFTLVLSGPSNATVLDGIGIGSIVDDDLQPDLSIADLSVPEADSGTSAASAVVTLSAASAKPVTVDHVTVDGTAVAGNDYATTSGTLTFAPGEIAKTIDVPILGDTTFEDDEELAIALSGGVNAQLADGGATVTIANDDATPTISVDDILIDEGASGDTGLRFTISLSNPSAFATSADAATADGTAATPTDYAPVAVTVAFAPGEITHTVDVSVHGDLAFEPDETLTLGLSNPSGATVADGSGVGTIVNDDAAPVLDVAGVTLSEGDAGDATASFVITLTGTTDLPARVDVATADGTASAPADLAPLATAVTFAPGETTKTVDVAVHGETVFENDEGFSVQLSNPTDATIGTATGTGTIVNDDPLPSISIADATVIEGDAGPTTVTLTLSLANASAFPTVADVASADGSAVSPTDYAGTSGTLTFAPGDSTATFDVAVAGDVLYEGDELFSVVVSAPVGGTLGDPTAQVTIADDEGVPVLSVADLAVMEGNASTTPATLTVTLSSDSGLPVSVDYAALDGTAGSSDYLATSGTLVFAPGETARDVRVDVLGDPGVEADETIRFVLSNPVGALLGDGSALATIVNDDADHPDADHRRPVVTIGSVERDEGDHGSTTVALPLLVSGSFDTAITVTYGSVEGTASTGEDFLPASGSVTLVPGSSAAIPVTILGDRVTEPDETFDIVIVDATGATAGGVGTVTIGNDDRGRTRMSIRPRIHGSRVMVRGRMIADRANLEVLVVLLRRADHRWVAVDRTVVRTVPTERTGRSDAITVFRVRFGHQPPGRVLVRARFDGDDLRSPSRARVRFRVV
jgi:chitinase